MELTEEEPDFIQKGETIIKQILSETNDLAAYEIMNKEILKMDPSSYKESEKYNEWLVKIALESKFHNIRMMAVEKLYDNDNVLGLIKIMRNTKDKKISQTSANLILESCKEYHSTSPLNTIVHKMGIGTEGIRIKPKDWTLELKDNITHIKNYTVRKEIAKEYHKLTKNGI